MRYLSVYAYTHLNSNPSKVNEFVTNNYQTPLINSLPNEAILLDGSARISNQLVDKITLFRSLTDNTALFDLIDFYAIIFLIHGYGKVHIRLEKDSIKNFDYHSKKLVHDESEQIVTTLFDEFKQLNGNVNPDLRLIEKFQ